MPKKLETPLDNHPDPSPNPEQLLEEKQVHATRQGRYRSLLKKLSKSDQELLHFRYQVHARLSEDEFYCKMLESTGTPADKRQRETQRIKTALSRVRGRLKAAAWFAATVFEEEAIYELELSLQEVESLLAEIGFPECFLKLSRAIEQPFALASTQRTRLTPRQPRVKLRLDVRSRAEAATRQDLAKHFVRWFECEVNRLPPYEAAVLCLVRFANISFREIVRLDTFGAIRQPTMALECAVAQLARELASSMSTSGVIS